MPYTPPTQHSPVASASHSPLSSRSHSYTNVATSHPVRPELPRSQSYLSRHRRTPSISKGIHFGSTPARPSTDVVTSTIQEGRSTNDSAPLSSHGSLHQSPAPVNDATMPAGAIISPADSSHNSSDDEDRPHRQRGRDLENLAELQAAIRIIEQHRESSPSRVRDEAKKARAALGLAIPEGKELSDVRPLKEALAPPLTEAARRITHSRSSTESAIITDVNQPTTPEKSSDDEDEDVPLRPLMVRKKSGELVKPALRPSSVRRRPSSMPGTPTYSKAVHFDNHLEHVRTFLTLDRPLAVSAGSSPVETFDGDVEFPFGSDDVAPPRKSPFEWEISLSNFPKETPARKAMPCHVERVFLSADNKNLIGTVAVANVAFNKFVVARFTLDYWKTTSEVVAEYNNDVRRKQANDGFDRFNFNIRLADQANLQNKTLFFCVRYTVNGQEHWDNNGFTNFQVDFRRKAAQGGNTRSLNSLPRSRPSPPAGGRPVSMPCSFDDFSNGFDLKYDFTLGRQPPAKLVGESPIRLRNSSSLNSGTLSENPVRRNNAPGQAFGNRYDFGASLSAAMSSTGAKGGSKMAGGFAAEPKSLANPGLVSPRSSMAPGTTATKQAQTAPGMAESAPLIADKPPLQSVSYHELLNKYCFVSSNRKMARPD